MISICKKTNLTNSQLKLDLKVAEEWIAVFAFAKIGGRQKSPIRLPVYNFPIDLTFSLKSRIPTKSKLDM